MTRVPRAAFLLLAAALLGASPPPGAAPGSGAEEGGAALAEPFSDWLGEVAPLLLPEEREAFLALSEDYQRRAFVRRFWEVRDPYPETARNELEERWRLRLEEARKRFANLSDARARLLLLLGPPLREVVPRCATRLDPVEIWTWAGGELVRGASTAVFVPGPRGIWRQWDPAAGVESLLHWDPSAPLRGTPARPWEQEPCSATEELAAVLARALTPSQVDDLATHLAPDPEWVAAFRARSTELPEGAAPLPGRFKVGFPGRHQSRTVVRGVVTLPAAAAGSAPGPGGEPGYAFVVDGEVLRQGELFESFRYRFDVPAGVVAGDEVPLVVERYLRPGDYRLLVRVEDLHGGGFFRHQQELAVPLVAGATSGPTAAAAAEARAPEAPPPATAAPPAATEPPPEPVVRLITPPDALLTGLVRLAAEVRGARVARVRFELDGKAVLAKSRPPYGVELDLGRLPRLHTVRAVAENAAGEELASDEITLNAGPHRFAVRLVEPVPGSGGGAGLRAEAVVEVPRGERLDRVELFLDETRLATLYQPPFAQPLPLVTPREGSYVRAVGHLVGGGSAEDLVFLDTPPNLDRLDVQLVELYTTVLDRRGRPATDLTAAELEVLEDGEPQSLVRFEWVENLPVHAAVLLDTSTSMAEELDEAEEAAEAFLRSLLTPRDRAAVITFNDRPALRVPFTSRTEVLAGGLAGLAVEGETALWDSMIYALHYFGGIRGKRMLVLLSDGADVRSTYSFDEVLDFARRAGVAIYAIGLNLAHDAGLERAALSHLAADTGGRAFFVNHAAELAPVYESIERELRSQYLLAYQPDPSKPAGTFRQVEVKVARPGLSARTIRGYLP